MNRKCVENVGLEAYIAGVIIAARGGKNQVLAMTEIGLERNSALFPPPGGERGRGGRGQRGRVPRRGAL